MLRCGRSLDDVPHRLSWHDLFAVLQVEAGTPGSPLDRAVRGDVAWWDHHGMLLREIHHSVQVLIWLTAGGTDSGQDYPDRLPLGNDTDTQDDGALDIDEYVQRYGGAPLD